MIETTAQFERLASGSFETGSASDIVELRVRIDRILEVEPSPRAVSIEFFRPIIR